MKTVNKKNNFQRFLIGFAPIMLIWLLVLLINILTTPVTIINAEESIPFKIYTDQELQGQSVGSVNTTQQHGIDFIYTLKEGYVYPYVGICFTPKSGILSFNANSTFTIEIETCADKIIPIILNEHVTGFSGKNFLRPVQYELNTQAGIHTYTISLKEFEVPAWWYKSNHFSEGDLPIFDPSNIKNICIQNSLLSAVNTEEYMHIKQISNRANTGFWVWIATIFSVCWLGGYGIHLVLKKKKTAVFIPYVVTPSEEEPVDEWERIRNYISFNYMNELDMEGMEKDLGIAKHKIASLIKDNTTLIFKQYLNQIKVAEAKRLLQETNLPIGEIADQVGFGHVSNFNRVFKQYAGESPSDCRLK